MNKTLLLLCILLPSFLYSQDGNNDPWQKFELNLALFGAETDSSVRFGTGIGFELDLEDFLGLESQNDIFRFDMKWRFTDNRRHRLDLGWFAFRNNSRIAARSDFDFGNGLGALITVPEGTEVHTKANLDIIQFSYNYSFFQDDRIDLSAGLGFYVVPIDFELEARGLINEQSAHDFTAPLPVLKLRAEFAITEKWFLSSEMQIFYLEYEQFSGGIFESNVAIEFRPHKNWGIGLAYEAFKLKLDAEGKDYPNIDLNGSVNYRYSGVLAYIKFTF